MENSIIILLFLELYETTILILLFNKRDRKTERLGTKWTCHHK